jgi:hypothetical protein
MQVEKALRGDPPPELGAIANANIDDLEAGKVGADAPAGTPKGAV